MPKDPMNVHDDLDNLTNMTAGELESWKDSDQFNKYKNAKSGGEPPTKPVDDMIRLLRTPKSEYENKNDGFNEVTEANQAISFINRMQGNESGDPIPGTDPPLSKRDASLLSWGRDPNPRRSDFTGDRQ